MTHELQNQFYRYALALSCVLLASLIWWLAVTPLVGTRAYTGFVLVAIIVAGRFAGFGPSWLALAAGGGCLTYVQYLRYLEDHSGIALRYWEYLQKGVDDSLPSVVAVFCVVGATLVLLTHSERVARQTAETNAHLLSQEIHERKAIEQRLREEHQQLELALSAGRFGTFDWDLRSGLATWSATNEAIHGFAPGTFSGAVATALEKLAPADRQALDQWIADATRSSPASPFAYRLTWPDGSTRWIEGVGQFLCNAVGKAIRVRGVCADITSRKHIEIALREAEERFRLLALHAPVGIYLADEAGRLTFVNHQWCEIAGAEFAAALGQDWTNYIHPLDSQRLRQTWTASRQDNQSFCLEYRYLHASGDIRWVEGSAVTLRNERGDVLGYVGTVMDITARKNSADALKAEQDLLRQSIELQERERQMIAYDIHDGIIQYTTGALMHLEGHRVRGGADADDNLPAVMALRQAIADGRRVMNGIRPPLLDDDGIVAAIEYLAGENRTDRIEMEAVVDRDIGRLMPELESALYRIAQEALFNAVKHSGTRKVRISLSRHDKVVRLVVRDWGSGFDLGKVSRGVHGLSGIKERVKLLGGQSSIQSSPHEGTSVSVDLPYIERAERVLQPAL